MIKRQQWTVLLGGLFVTAIGSANAADLEPLKGQEVLRVCADKNNMPYSNGDLEGFDNKIAALLGEELGIPVEYYWFPQRIGFARNTLKKEHPTEARYMCDVAFNISETSDFVKTTNPYYESIEVVAYRSGEGYDINKLTDIKMANEQHGPLKIGLFDRALTTKHIVDMGLADNIVYYQMMAGGWDVTPGRIIEDLAAGKVDVVPMWGPIAGYYGARQDVDIAVKPLNELGQRHVFAFSMGTRYGEPKWTALLNKFIEKRQDDIDAIIAEYNLPSLENVSPTPAKRIRKDDDD
ncbi:MxaJ protein [Methylophaga frappieri]|uniref:MxaJ protein n=1 Tax=Methylophaga frappieri (strain ATCC BAA-2434 / DSM 25690 / JAM7) TaxID=754477 RepID=I1YKA3_METFJ|nr:quinoprotein dehydrogenase-associated putative ABC transporter substrate-binding protein [Methylophaga frappieri]AFJ03346.1 MxaJ protein [Methylophaga frappieri]